MSVNASDKLGVRDIFCAVRQQTTADEKAQILDELCADNEPLRRQVVHLLSAAASASPLDRVGAMLNPTELKVDSEPSQLPLVDIENHPVIGPYKLLEQIGEGGMGVVYRAQQQTPIRRTVALKIIKPGMASRQVLARFEAERQALAMMNHPHIAKILDAGATESGSPYIVMELVKGIPITRYCDRHKLDLRQRLELFVKVCHAVQHAHQKGVIHRDLKPSNILVELDDVRAVPKVIDFGVAKATQEQLTKYSLYTGLSQMIGTPLYMSPEQAQLNSQDIDTRSDVYSLGVLLYELLTGSTPFNAETLKQAGFDEMRKIIRDVEPPRPSQRVSTLAAEAISTLNERRGIDSRQLSKMLGGELDWIVMKALEKDRSRRYESPNAFAADIARYLKDDAVEASPPSWRYRLVKITRRNRIAVMFAGGVLASLVLGLSVAFWQLQLAIIAKSETAAALSVLEKQKVVSDRRLAIAEQAVDEMYVQVASKWLSKAAGITITQVQREFLEKAIVIYEKLAETDHISSSTHLRSIAASIKLGSLHRRLGRNDQALDILLKSIRLATEFCDRESQNSSAKLKLSEAQAITAGIYRDRGLSDQSIDLAGKAFVNLRAIDSDKLEDLAEKETYVRCLRNLTGALATEKSRKDEAKKAAELSVSEARLLVDQFPENKDLRYGLADSYSVQGFQLLWWGGQDEDCLAAYQSCMSLLDELGQQGYSDSAILAASSTPLNNICILLSRFDRKNELLAAREKQRAVMEELCLRFPENADHKEDFANCLIAMAELSNERGDRIEADKYDQRARAILTTIVEQTSSPRVTVFAKLIVLLTRIGSQYADSSNDLMAIEALEEANLRQFAFSTLLPKDFQVFVLGFNVMAELAPAYLRVGNHGKAADLVVACMRSHAARVAAIGSQTDNLPTQKLSGLVLSLTCFARLMEYCEQAAVEDKSMPDDRRMEILESHRMNRQSALTDLSPNVELWSKSVIKSDSPLTEIEALLGSNASHLVTSLVDGDNSYLFPSFENSLQFVIENSIVERNVLLVKAYLAAIELSQQVPKQWSSVAMLLSSSSELNVAPKTLMKFCDLALSEAPNDLLTQQAWAWALYRNGRWNECIAILDSDTMRLDPCNGYVLAMAYYHLGDEAKAAQMFQEMEILESSTSNPTRSVELPRLKWEARSLLKINGNENHRLP